MGHSIQTVCLVCPGLPFSNCKLVVKFKLGPQRLAQLGIQMYTGCLCVHCHGGFVTNLFSDMSVVLFTLSYIHS